MCINNCSQDVTLSLRELSVAMQVPEESVANGNLATRILQTHKGGGGLGFKALCLGLPLRSDVASYVKY